MRHVILFLIFIIGIFPNVFSQTSHYTSSEVSYKILKQQLGITLDYSIKNYKNKTSHNSFLDAHTLFQQDIKSIPRAYNFHDLGFFCKVEVQVEQKTKIPIKFRLGEYNQIERLEGKPFNPFLIQN